MRTRALRLLWLPVGLAALGIALSFYQPFWLIRAIQRLVPGVLFYVPTSAPVVALTLDDGPDDSVTPAVLGILRREKVRATWFVIGERVKRYPDVYRAIIADGHEVANHFWSETPTWRMDVARFTRDLLRTEALIHQRVRPRMMRPASGWIRPWGIRQSAALGYTIVLGSAYASDPARPPSAYLRWALTRMARPGGIIVLHVGRGRKRTPEVLPAIIRGIRAKGLRFVTVSQLSSRQVLSTSARDHQ
jgi:peptidoglycan/xylan/chitin deacetylase (PgdA/CDA1 family)